MNHKKMEWYLHDRVGMFIHWGIYSVLGHGEWAMSRERITAEDYQTNYDNFNPKNFNPKQWAKLAKNAGMQYAIMTSKHHDGFCLFDSEYTDYKSTNTALGRDAIREFVNAFRAEGIKVGIYYSLMDWHHPDYPAYGDLNAPMRDNPAFKEKEKEKDFSCYLKYMHAQVEELMTKYGKIDLLWLDYSYDNMRGEKWEATKLVNMIKKYQPHIIINNRLEVSGSGFGSLITDNPTAYSGDFVTPEQVIPPAGIRNAKGEAIPWESCITMNNHWAYRNGDDSFKPADLLIRRLVECVSKGGNMLINVGPNADGEIPEKSVCVLNEIGTWLRMNGESIYGCGYAGLSKPEYGRITRKDNTYYYHIFETPIGPFALEGLKKDEIERVELLINGRELAIANTWVVDNYPDIAFVSLGHNEEYTFPLPDPKDTVLKVTMKQSFCDCRQE